jgi:hypothetical protein
VGDPDGDVVSALPAIVAAVKTRVATVPGILEVLDHPPLVELEAAEMPLAFIDVNGLTLLEGTSRRRHMVWEIGIVVLGSLLGPDRQLDVSALHPLPELIVAAFDDGLTLGGALSKPLTFNDPITDGIGPIGVMTSLYLGFAVTANCPIYAIREANP